MTSNGTYRRSAGGLHVLNYVRTFVIDVSWPSDIYSKLRRVWFHCSVLASAGISYKCVFRNPGFNPRLRWGFWLFVGISYKYVLIGVMIWVSTPTGFWNHDQDSRFRIACMMWHISSAIAGKWIFWIGFMIWASTHAIAGVWNHDQRARSKLLACDVVLTSWHFHNKCVELGLNSRLF